MRPASNSGRLYEPRRRWAARAAAAALAVAICATLAVPAGAAPRAERPTRVTVRFDGSSWQFRGHVTASGRCTRSRTIVIYGNSIGHDRRVGKGRTGQLGRYRIDPEQLLVGADYYAIARQGGNASGSSCDKAVSKRFRVGA